MITSIPVLPVTRLRVLIADDHLIVRDGLRLLIGTQADLELIGEASNGLMALELCRSLRPDVILMDLRMPFVNGTELIESLTLELPSITVLVMSSSENSADVAAALRAGARGYLSKGANHLEVLSAIRAVAQGGMVLGQAVAGGVLGSLEQNSLQQNAITTIMQAPIQPRKVFAELTDREYAVLEVLAGDLRNREIAARLEITEKTVRNHISNILWKLQAADRATVIERARQAGLGQPMVEVVNHLESAGQMLEPAITSPPVGREREWTQLEAAWNAGVFIYITGPAGVGKTWLMNEFAASRGGAFVKFAGLPSDMSVPFGSFARSIRKMLNLFPEIKLEPWITDELRRIVPTIRSDQSRTGSTSNEESKLRLFDAIAACHVTFAPHMAGLLVDDIQYFDPLSAEASMYTLSSWERFSGKAGEAQHAIACYRSGMFPPEIEQGIRQQAQAGMVALIELEPFGSNLDVLPSASNLEQPRANAEYGQPIAVKPRIQN
jgi:DNA-binding NarL/FixJ family response regulator